MDGREVILVRSARDLYHQFRTTFTMPDGQPLPVQSLNLYH